MVGEGTLPIFSLSKASMLHCWVGDKQTFKKDPQEKLNLSFQVNTLTSLSCWLAPLIDDTTVKVVTSKNKG